MNVSSHNLNQTVRAPHFHLSSAAAQAPESMDREGGLWKVGLPSETLLES